MTASEAQVVVSDHGDFVSARFPNGDSETLSWDELTRVEVRTNESGPWGWDVWLVLVGERDRVTFPLGATGQDEVLTKIESVTGQLRTDLFDGMNCTENRTFVTWEESPAN